jgi:hypothetical protein
MAQLENVMINKEGGRPELFSSTERFYLYPLIHAIFLTCAKTWCLGWTRTYTGSMAKISSFLVSFYTIYIYGPYRSLNPNFTFPTTNIASKRPHSRRWKYYCRWWFNKIDSGKNLWCQRFSQNSQSSLFSPKKRFF